MTIAPSQICSPTSISHFNMLGTKIMSDHDIPFCTQVEHRKLENMYHEPS
jgi:hypothetical protein